MGLGAGPHRVSGLLWKTEEAKSEPAQFTQCQPACSPTGSKHNGHSRALAAVPDRVRG